MSISEEPSLASSIGARLCEERVRLQMTQGALAKAVGISRTSATMYEAGRQMPGAEVMLGLHHLGADILFILTGKRARNAPLDVSRFDAALTEANRQSRENNEQLNQRELLNRAWVIYQALTSFMVAQTTNRAGDLSK
jgi:transcriptional regulator with XRE-family HTH domain